MNESNETSYTGRDLRRSDFRGCRLKNADFKDAVLDDSRFDGADVQDSDFSGAQLFRVKAPNASFAGGVFRRANLQGAILDGTDLSRADLAGADLKFACLEGVRLEGTNVSRADFRFSRGLSLSEKAEFRRQGAKVTTVGDRLRRAWRSVARTFWGKAAYVLIALGLVWGLYVYLSGYPFASIQSLRIKAADAKRQQDYRRAIRIDLALSKKYVRHVNLDASVNWRLEAAGVYRAIGKKPEALATINRLLKTVSDETQVSKIKLEQALYFEADGRRDEALTLMKEIRAEPLLNNFDASMKLGRLYQAMGERSAAAGVFRALIERYGQNPARRTAAESALSLVVERNEKKPPAESDRNAGGPSLQPGNGALP
jgi:uncharacterized protein YjbI with pentapeptide repeats